MTSYQYIAARVYLGFSALTKDRNAPPSQAEVVLYNMCFEYQKKNPCPPNIT